MQTELGDKETTEVSEKVAEIDVLAPALPARKAGRDPETGQFLPANSIGAVGRRGRSRKAKVLDLIESTVDPAVVVDTILGLITDYNSWRAREAGVKLYLSYMVGMPVQRSVTATTKLETILSQLGSMDDSEFTQVEEQMRGE